MHADLGEGFGRNGIMRYAPLDLANSQHTGKTGCDLKRHNDLKQGHAVRCRYNGIDCSFRP